MEKKLSKYIVTGAIGFATDFLSFLFFINVGWSVYVCRVLAFIVAVQVTYTINTRWTFSDKHGNQTKYFIGQVCGIIVNFMVFTLFFAYIFTGDYIVSFCLGSAITLVFNFLVANYWAFKAKS